MVLILLAASEITKLYGKIITDLMRYMKDIPSWCCPFLAIRSRQLRSIPLLRLIFTAGIIIPCGTTFCQELIFASPKKPSEVNSVPTRETRSIGITWGGIHSVYFKSGGMEELGTVNNEQVVILAKDVNWCKIKWKDTVGYISTMWIDKFLLYYDLDSAKIAEERKKRDNVLSRQYYVFNSGDSIGFVIKAVDYKDNYISFWTRRDLSLISFLKVDDLERAIAKRTPLVVEDSAIKEAVKDRYRLLLEAQKAKDAKELAEKRIKDSILSVEQRMRYEEVRKTEIELEKQEKERIAERKRLEDKKKAVAEKAERDKFDKLLTKYGVSEFLNAIINKKIKIGMTSAMVIDSWGKPQSINKSVGSWGVHEQWVYSSAYLYFENGVMTSYQTQR